ncbi:MAG: hypothetical protein ABL903_02725 [Methylococcales bacterium]
MNNQLINIFDPTLGINWVVDFFKTLAGADSEIPLAEALIISRVLFAVVMFGFIGYFFDRMKQSAPAAKITAKTKHSQRK